MNTPNARSHRWLPALTLATLLMLFTCAPPAAQAADANPPSKMTFQGFLTDANNVPLGNTSPVNKEVIFRIYDNATGGAVKWAETQVVTVDKGHFSVLLGEGATVTSQAHPDLHTVFIGADASDRWIGISFDGAEITPRIQFFAAPYSQLARAANSLVNPSGSTILNLANGKLEGTADLSVTGKVTSGGSLAGLIFNDRGGSGPAWQWYSSSGTARLSGTGGDTVAVTSDGKVGIGNTAPTEKLDVTGNIKVVGNITATGIVKSSGSVAALTFADRKGLAEFKDWEWYSETGTAVLWNGVNRLLAATSGGKVGIGTIEPTSTLHVIGDAKVSANVEVGGNVGIGTSSPAQRLDVQGKITLKDTETRTLPAGLTTEASSSLLQFGINEGSGNRFGTYVSANQGGMLRFDGRTGQPLLQIYGRPANEESGAGSLRMVVLSDGKVGIGIQSPAAPLHVKKAGTDTSGTRKTGSDTAYGVYLGGDGAVLTAGGVDNVSGDNNTIKAGALSAVFDGDIIASAHVWVGSALAYSDARAKNVVSTSDSVRDLSLLRDLKIRDFTWIDRTVDSHRPNKKLVAQEVEQVFPQAVERTPQPTAIPNVYQVAEKVEFVEGRKELHLTLGKSHDLQVGDSVDIYTDDTPMKNVKVTAVSGEREFTVSCDHAPKRVFVYGKYVTDFRAVDYDAISMLNVSATQELDRQVQALKMSEARIAELELKVARVAELEQKAARVESLEREMAELKKFVAGLAQGQIEQRPAVRRIAARQ